MASLYRKPIVTVDPVTGEKVHKTAPKWWGRYRDSTGRERRVPLAKDKAAAQAMLNQLVKQSEREKSGLTDSYDKERLRPIQDQIADYEASLRNRGASQSHVRATLQRVRSVCQGCRITRLADISASQVEQYLAKLRNGGKSIASSNHYLRAMKMFLRWLVKDRRLLDNPISHLDGLNVELDRRRIRRPLSTDEFERLLDSTRKGRKRLCIPGPDREILYIIAAYTGFRVGEIDSVTAQSFDFQSTPPTMTVAAGYSKRRRTDVIPLRDDLAQRIQKWLLSKGGLENDQQLFRIAGKRTALMLQRDLEQARKEWLQEAKGNPAELARREKTSFLKYIDDRGLYVDFHALRKTFITNLARAGVSPKTAQVLARHSDINLTMNTYTMLEVYDQSVAVAALPPLPKR